MTEISYIVIDLDGGDMLERCIASILAQTLPAKEIVVVDNGSREPVAQRISAHREVRIIRNEINRGFAGGANAGYAAVASSLVAFVNNDVVLDPRWAARLAARLDADRDIAAIQPVILDSGGTVDGAGIALVDGRIAQRGHGLRAEELGSAPQAWGVSATAALYRRAALDPIAREGHVFEESFFAYYEDADLSARLLRAGWKLAIHDEALATHAASSSAPKLGSLSDLLRTRNRYFFARRHPKLSRKTALLREDARRFMSRIVRLDLSGALRLARGVVLGLYAATRR